MRGEPDWALTDAQFAWFQAQHALVFVCLTPPYAGDHKALRAAYESAEFQRIFGAMSFDEGFDRYETALLYEADGLTEVERAAKE